MSQSSKSVLKNPSKVSKSASQRPSVTIGLKGQKGAKDKPGIPNQPGKGNKEFTLPAFSIVPQKKKEEINWDKIKKQMMRRNSPEGEDIKQIKRIMKEIGDEDIPVYDFVTLISSYTADNGTLLRTIMAEDLESFRKLARKVYETMTQDVSDVLVNEQLQMVQYYQEKHDHFTNKMMGYVSEIYEIAPKFDFEKYLTRKQDYLDEVLPLPNIVIKDDEEIELLRRQEAWHRLQWLGMEGDRMREENKRLQQRLQELKAEQFEAQNRAAQEAAEAESKREQLVNAENEMKEKLEKLNEKTEKAFVENEANISKRSNKILVKAPEKSEVKVAKRPKMVKRPEWSVVQASAMEDLAVQETISGEVSKAASRASVRKPKRPKSEQPSVQEDPDCFCFENDQTKLSQGAKPKIPKTTFAAPKPPPQVDTRLEEVTTITHKKRPLPQGSCFK